MNTIKRIFAVYFHSTFGDATLLILRVVVGVAFMYHGWGKIQQPFGWMGPEAPIPGVFQFLAAFSEFAGGLAWVVGALTPLASFGLLCTMVVAVLFHAGQGHPFVPSGPGEPSYELAAVYLAISLLFIGIGPGRFSVDRYIFGTRSAQS